MRLRSGTRGAGGLERRNSITRLLSRCEAGCFVRLFQEALYKLRCKRARSTSAAVSNVARPARPSADSDMRTRCRVQIPRSVYYMLTPHEPALTCEGPIKTAGASTRRRQCLQRGPGEYLPSSATLAQKVDSSAALG